MPIYDKNILEGIKLYLRRKSYRDYMLFFLGINTGLRISELLSLKVSDVKNNRHITIKQNKTKKVRKVYINKTVKRTLNKYILRLKYDDFLFQSQRQKKPISRQTAHKIFKDIQDVFKLDFFASHTMRKTFGYWQYQKYKDLAVLTDIFGHSCEKVTMHYLGITQEILDGYMQDFNL